MALRNIRKYGDDLLRKKSRKVEKIDDRVLTLIEDIYAIPISSFLSISLKDFFKSSKFNITDFKQYFKLEYSFTGGNLHNTQTLLENSLAFLSKQRFAVPISGGVDSSLMNYMINDYVTEPYPAYYLTFGKKDTELPFAKEAIKKTKAVLEIVQMNPQDFEEAFYYQSEHLVQPVGESSTISMAHFLKNNPFKNTSILDGTLADGCYGSKNYYLSIYNSFNNSTSFKKHIRELISSFLISNNLPFQNRFHPRDAFINDHALIQMAHYSGSLMNTYFKHSKKYSLMIEPYWLWYYQLLSCTKNCKEIDFWMRYSIFKMANYAANTTIAKTIDMCGNTNMMVFPFMWLEILEDQGTYTWSEKTKNNIIKYPLKKILEKYASKSFIYRKKVGLNSSVDDWMSLISNKNMMLNIISRKSSLPNTLLGSKNLNLLKQAFKREKPHQYVSNMVISLANLEQWRISNKCLIE